MGLRSKGFRFEGGGRQIKMVRLFGHDIVFIWSYV